MNDLIYQPMFWFKVYALGVVLFLVTAAYFFVRGWYRGEDVLLKDVFFGCMMALASWLSYAMFMLSLLEDLGEGPILVKGRKLKPPTCWEGSSRPKFTDDMGRSDTKEDCR